MANLLLLSLVLCINAAAAADASEHLARILYYEPNEHIEALGKLSEEPHMLVRTYMSQPHKDAAQQISRWMLDAGMDSWVDAIGNVHGFINSSDPEAPAVLMGSHYDTIVDAGKYDGNLGIIVAIAAVKALGVRHLQAHGLGAPAPAEGQELVVPLGTLAGALRNPLHIIAFCDEEGVRFKSTFLGSRAIAGTHGQHGVLSARDEANASVIEVLRSNGVPDPESEVDKLAIPPVNVKQYVEVHIEQGPVLEQAGQPLGAVSAILGQTWLLVHVTGEQGHAGTVPMRGRKDALAAASELVVTIERKCGGGPYQDDRVAKLRIDDSERLVCTVGKFSIHPGATNVIPGAVNFTVDIRSRGEPARRRVVYDIQRAIIATCKLRGVSCTVHPMHSARGAEADPEIVSALHRAILDSRPLFRQLLAQLPHEQAEGEGEGAAAAEQPGSCGAGGAEQQCSSGLPEDEEVPVMVSGAGHDALAISDIANFGMMFVRCRGGISHSPLEYVAPADVAAATAALTVYLEQEVL